MKFTRRGGQHGMDRHRSHGDEGSGRAQLEAAEIQAGLPSNQTSNPPPDGFLPSYFSSFLLFSALRGREYR